MLDLLLRIGGMVALRPYVFVFFAVYLFAAVTRMGWKKTAVFTLISYAVAFAAECSSTRTGFPFGLYRYVDATRGRELWIANVPFWDSLSFSFLCYLGFSLAVLLYSPVHVRPGDVQIVDTCEIRQSRRVLITATVFTTLIDVVIDPLTVRGDQWFLGKVYFYPEGGIYFGVPISNFVGWAFVGAVTVALFQWFERRQWLSSDLKRPSGLRHVPYGGLIEPLLYLGILLFNIVLTFAIGETLLGIVAIMIFLPVIVLFAANFVDPRRRADAAQLATHRYDFPHSRIVGRS
ncbi:MAG: carotenoid biosynthesis protein [Candidatus Binatia bacterium]